MKLMAMVVALGFVGCAATKQTTQVREGQGPGDAMVIDTAAVTRVPAGSTIWVTLSEELSSDRNKVGDTVTAEVTQDVLNSDKRLLIPAGSVVIGEVTELREAEGENPAVVGVRFDTLRIAGVSQPLEATVTEANVEGTPRVRGRDVAIGAAAGAVLGTIIKPGKGTLAGAAVGAAGGGLISLGLNKGDARLPAGTAMALQLQDEVRSLAAVERAKTKK